MLEKLKMKPLTSLIDTIKVYGMLINARRIKIFPWPWTAIIGLLIASRGAPPILPSIITVSAMVAIAICVYTYNDVIDLDMDRMNPEKVNRPLPSGKASKKQAMSLVYLSGFIGISLLFLTRFEVFILCLTFMILYLAYSNPHIRLKKRFVLKESTLAVGGLLSLLAGAMVVGSISLSIVFLGMFLSSWAIIASITFVDVPDVKEDAESGIKTITMLFKWKTKIEIAIAFVLIVMTLTPLTYIQLQFNVLFPIAVVILCLWFLRTLFPLISNFEKTKFLRAFNTAYRFFILVEIVAVIGSLPFYT